jgi:hypothetical protein
MVACARLYGISFVNGIGKMWKWMKVLILNELNKIL